MSAQGISSRQFPPDLKWKQIETEKFTLIFPEELEPKAAEIAAMIDSYFPADEASLNTATGKWPIVLNNRYTISNAYVTAAPKHSQLYALPPQGGSLGTGDWLSTVWSHELRHIVQNEKMNRGFTAFMTFIAGQYGWSGMSHAALPRMYWEGDAVLTETLLSSSGRGRLPSFERGLRTNLLSGIRFGYNKSVLGRYGSYTDNVQSWYVTGYHFCTYLRREYGIEAFNRILEISADFSFVPLISSIAVEQVTGKTAEILYDECMDELELLWRHQLERTPVTEAERIREGSEGDTVNYYPLGIFEDGNAAALKTSKSQRPGLVEIMPNGSDRLLRTINPADLNISFNGKTFCWSEQKPDPRWGMTTWSVIRLFTPEDGEFRLLTENSRYFAPALSPDGKAVAAAEYSRELESAVVVLDSSTGRPLRKFPEPEGAVALQPCWSRDGSSIVYIRQQDNKKSLRLIEYPGGNERELSPPSFDNIESPETAGDGWIYYVDSGSGVDKINALSPDGKHYTAVSRAFGTASPAAAGARLLFSDYTPGGWALAGTEISAAGLIPAELSKPQHVDYFEPLKSEEPWEGGPAAAAPDKTYEITDYSVLSGLFNYHSRALGISQSGSGITFLLKADDILGYSSNQLYAGWDPARLEFLTGFAGAWAGWLPVILYGAELTSPAAAFGTEWNASAYCGAALPLNFSEGSWNNILTAQAVFYLQTPISLNPSASTAVDSRVSWGYTEIGAARDLMPPLGIELVARWYYSLVPSAFNFASAEASFYLPGFIDNHGIRLTLEGEHNIGSPAVILQPDKMPRGISPTGLAFPTLFNASADYSLPLLYPDLGLGGFVYIPRLYMNLFFDAAAAFTESGSFPDPAAAAWYTTAGIELYADFHLFNNIVPLKSGVRVLYDFQSGRIRIEDTVLLLGISLP